MMLLIPLLAIGAIAILATRHQASSALQVPQPSMPVHASGATPSPIAVLDHFLRIGQTPPPFVIACAIAEAELIGRLDLSRALVDAFIRPVVARAEAAEAARVMNARDANPLSWGAAQAMPASPSTSAPAYQMPMPPLGERRRRHLHAEDDAGDQEMWAPAGSFPAPDPAGASARSAAPGPIGIPSIADPAYGTRVEIVERPDRPMASPVARARHEPTPPPSAPNEGTITVSGMNSPIADISNEAWGSFASRVSRQLPTFSTARHVGQFRQRRERLVELGFDPDSVASSPELQQKAFNADMADAYLHASESGLIAEYRGAVVEIPAPSAGSATPIEVTMSGVMGVIQAAGLEGAVAWLERPEDRRRFPNTTAAFLRANGAF
jgi:hypothetical protein